MIFRRNKHRPRVVAAQKEAAKVAALSLMNAQLNGSCTVQPCVKYGQEFHTLLMEKIATEHDHYQAHGSCSTW